MYSESCTPIDSWLLRVFSAWLRKLLRARSTSSFVGGALAERLDDLLDLVADRLDPDRPSSRTAPKMCRPDRRP
jgi:hypothetical protein